MDRSLFADPRVRSLRWRDLVRPTKAQTVRELLLVVPWLAASLALAHAGDRFHWLFYGPALVCSFVFFLTGLRVVHNGYHYSLGISRWATEWVMFVLSILLVWPLHAVQVNHLRHHTHCLDEGDVEAVSARMSGLGALLFGPIFPWLLLVSGWYHGHWRARLWIVAEMLACGMVVVTALLVLDVAFLRYHVCCMALGECLTSFFAVWTVHHDSDHVGALGRTSSRRRLNRLTFNMFLHLEHHLFPAVPTCNLPRLAARLDAAAPDLRRHQVL